MPQFSIIIPVYRVEEYLEKCVDSILAQTCQDFELLLIDDGSPDGSGAICDRYAASLFRLYGRAKKLLRERMAAKQGKAGDADA